MNWYVKPCVKSFEDIYDFFPVAVIFDRENKKIPVKDGIRQADRISPVLFTACLQEAFMTLEWEQLPISVNGELLNSWRFADHITLLSNSRDQLQCMITDLDRENRVVGLRNTMHKSKLMFSNLGRGQRFEIRRKALEVVREDCFVQVVTTDRNYEYEVYRRIRMG